MSISVVFGLGYGDEGKGHVVDWIASGRPTPRRNAMPMPDPVVIRFCGGPQAGHTVVRTTGQRHVFHTFGSASFCSDAETHISRYAAFDPLSARREKIELVDVGVSHLSLSVDPDAPLLTPYDMLLNQLQELSRGAARHGSCGYGVGECFRREEETPYRLRARDVDSPLFSAKLHALYGYFLDEIRRRGISAKMSALDADARRLVEAWTDAAKDRGLWTLCSTHLLRPRNIIFEGAQGLLLDRDHGAFPHVTRAKTDLTNVGKILTEMQLNTEMSVYGVTRAYQTRHGAGPLPGEADLELIEGNGTDATNAENQWQGALRYAPLDTRQVTWALNCALESLGPARRDYCMTRVTVTCADHIPADGVLVVDGGTTLRWTPAHFRAWAPYISAGPATNHFAGSN